MDVRLILDSDDNRFYLLDDDGGDNHGPFTDEHEARLYASENDMTITSGGDS